jgi:hypothetical protein
MSARTTSERFPHHAPHFAGLMMPRQFPMGISSRKTLITGIKIKSRSHRSNHLSITARAPPFMPSLLARSA